MMTRSFILSEQAWLKLRVTLASFVMLFMNFAPSFTWSASPPVSPLHIEATSTTASIEAHKVPLADILRALGVQVGFEVIAQEPGATRSLSLKQVPLAEALEQLLLGANFVIEYAQPTDNVDSAPRTIATIFLLPEISPEIAEQERTNREAIQVQAAAADDIPHPIDQTLDSSFSSESSFQKRGHQEEAVSSASKGNRSLAASHALRQQLNPLRDVPPDTPNSKPIVSSGQQVPSALQQQALEQVRALADQLETARQQLRN